MSKKRRHSSADELFYGYRSETAKKVSSTWDEIAQAGSEENLALTEMSKEHVVPKAILRKFADVQAFNFANGSRYLFEVKHVSPLQTQEESEPPSFGETVLWYVCSSDELEVVIGNLAELFTKRVRSKGLSAARRWYWWQVTKAVVAFAMKILESGLGIIRAFSQLGQ